MDLFFIFFAQYLFVLPVLISGIYFLFQNSTHKKEILLFALPSLGLTYLLALLGAHFYFDPRPFVVDNFTPLIAHAPDNGFPSDHALLVASIASIGTSINRRLGILLWILAVLVGIGRVYVGIHHPIDVAGSFFIAILATSAVYFFYRYLLGKKFLF